MSKIGIKVKQLRVIPDERGRLGEIFRCDDENFLKFGQIYFTTTYSGVVKGWHQHIVQTDNVACIKGLIKLVVAKKIDDKWEVEEYYTGEHRPLLITIPPKIFHGWMCVSYDEAYIINVPSEAYNYDHPDEIRLSPYDSEIPYRWERKNG